MTFKTKWEKTDQYVGIAPQTIAAMVGQAFSEKPLLAYEVISGGCANLNIKVILESGPYILRVYLRDQEAAYRECHIASFMKYDIPIPEVLYIGDQTEGDSSYRFAVTQFMEGIPLRDLLLNYPEEVWREVMVDAGEMLYKFRGISFPQAGFIDGNLDVPSPFKPDDLVNFVADCLKNLQVQKALGESTVHQLKELFHTHRLYLPDESDPHLVHGDFDPANILVHQVDGKWEISAILDWEFAFAGAWLWDVANMLRYAHQMPKVYEESFLEGLKKGGLELPKDWRITIALLNISSLLDSLARHPIHERPVLQKDICELIGHMIERIEE